MCVVGTRIGKIVRSTSKCTRLKKDNVAVVEELRSVHRDAVVGTSDTNEEVEHFLMNIIDSAERNNTRELTLNRFKFNLKQWITESLFKCQRNRDRLHFKAKKNSSIKTTQTIQ